MSADFNTELTVKGTKEEYLAILKVLHTYADERRQQYREQRNCWYLDGMIGEDTEKAVEEYLEKGVFSIGFSGPYGVMNGPVTDEVDLFERLADAAPGCSFEGSISGWNPGAERGIDAKLENGLLYLRYTYKEFGGKWDENDDDEDDLDEDDEECEGEESLGWDRVYDPISHQYNNASNIDGSGTVTVTITLTDLDEKQYTLVLPSENVEDPTNLKCLPTDFLEADTADELISLLKMSVDGEGYEKRKAEISAWRAELPNNAFSTLKLTKIHDHKDPLFFDWLRASSTFPEMKKLAKKVCTSTEKNKQKNLELFEECLQNIEPWFPWCEWTGWPEFCREGIGYGLRQHASFSKLEPQLDWSCIADSPEEFARIICAKEEPWEYAVETVFVDYKTDSAEQSSVYMPGGPKSKKHG